MPSASLLRNQIETALANRIASALSPVPSDFRSRTATGIRDVDATLEGGLAPAAITELVGAPCSGRTSMALACLSALTQTGNVCAWIDVTDALEPESVVANGVNLERLLWVRCGPQRTSALNHAVGECTALSENRSSTVQHGHTGGGSPHPRSEGRDMPAAIGSMLQTHGGLSDHQVRREKKAIGTPGIPNRPLTQRPHDRVEQVNSDRLPPRRGDNLAIAPRCAEPLPRRVASIPSNTRLPVTPTDRPQAVTSFQWQALDQALRVTDLLLQNGGFGAIVLDLGDLPPEVAWRIPMATWFRFRAACERTRVSLLLLTQHPCARSSTERVVRMETGSIESNGKVMSGILYQAGVERQRNRPEQVVPIRKPPQPDRTSHKPGQWRSEAPWALAR